MASQPPAAGDHIDKSAQLSRRKRVLFSILLTFGVPIATLVTFEGVSSLLLVGRAAIVATRPVFAEEINTQYDPELGWIAKKSFAGPNLYGPGVGLYTNARGFRGQAPVDDALPDGKRRIVCSGDSFTLGYGVADAETWCARLGSEGVETVNMGQGGYGIDQAYLWYARDARALEHTVHILAFVTHDFARMAMQSFIGYAKPTLAVEHGELVVRGVPAPRRDRARTTRRLGRAIQSLRTATLLTGLTRNKQERADPPDDRPDTTGTRDVVAQLVANLARVNAVKQSRLVLVYLPGEGDHVNDDARPWREQMRIVADSLGVAFIDLIPELRKRTKRELQSMYFQQIHELTFFGATGHLTAEGNRWAAEAIRGQLDSLGILVAPLATASTAPGTR